MLLKFSSAVLAASYAATTLATDTIRCGSTNPSNALLAVTRNSSKTSADTDGRSLEVDTYFHVVTSEDQEGMVTDEMLSAQLDKINHDYGPHGISFNLIDTDFTVNGNWSTGLEPVNMGTELRQGTYADLNIYFLSDLEAFAFLGLCTFPKQLERDSPQFYEDGCYIQATTVPGGSKEHFNLGVTATHEVGHWFGLFHVFQGLSCSGEGDNILDTPQQSTQSSGCDEGKDSCPDQAGLDSIHNYMDYSYDECTTEFTENQGSRMFLSWDVYRSWQ